MSLIDTLHGFAKKEVTLEGAVRALIAYDGWYVPGGWAAQITKSQVFEHACIWGAQARNVPPGQLFLFSDASYGPKLQAKDVDPGFYVGPVPGHVVFSQLPDALAAVKINPGAPVEDGFFFGHEAIPLIRTWGRAIGLEKALDGVADDMIDRLIGFNSYLLFVNAQRVVATAMGAGGLKNPAMLFTAPDCFDAALAHFKGAPGLTQATVTGATFFSNFDGYGIDGAVINLCGPGPQRLFDAEICRGIGQAIKDRAELARLEALAKQES